jgi:branched-chain amino acid aminotransferase
MKIYINGRIVPAKKARISVLDRGFNYGDGLFETMRSHSGKIFMAKEHLKRLKDGAKRLGIPTDTLTNLFDPSPDGALMKTLAANNLMNLDGRVKVILTGGTGDIGPSLKTQTMPTVVVMAVPLDVRPIERIQRNGVGAMLVKDFNPPVPGLKTLNYLPFLIAKAEAIRQKKFEAIFIDGKNNLMEGSSTNLFVVSRGELLTPDLKDGILPGITRAAIIAIAKKMGIKTRSTRISRRMLASVDEAFLTNSIIEMVPLNSVDGEKIGTGRPGPITRALQEELRRMIVEKDLGKSV